MLCNGHNDSTIVVQRYRQYPIASRVMPSLYRMAEQSSLAEGRLFLACLIDIIENVI